MNTRLHLVLIPMLCMALNQKAHADEYYFGTAERATKMVAGSEPDMLRGVLIERSRQGLRLRIVGGEVSVPHLMVYKIISDDLTIADIEREEAAIADTLAAANALRIEYQAEEAAERLARTRAARHQQAEIDARHAERSAHQHGADHGLSYDPIIRRSIGSMLDFVVSGYIQQEFGGHIRRHVQRALRRRQR